MTVAERLTATAIESSEEGKLYSVLTPSTNCIALSRVRPNTS